VYSDTVGFGIPDQEDVPGMTKVFISSTGKDLEAYRNAAREECGRLSLVSVAMEFFEAMAGAGAGR
jgi:hypothetical protein